MPDVTITIRRNGAFKVEGPVRLIDSNGNEIVVDKPVISLCRCGHSQKKPYCDSSHKLCGFNGVEAHIAAAEQAAAASSEN